jgi:hypothetical protein
MGRSPDYRCTKIADIRPNCAETSNASAAHLDVSLADFNTFSARASFENTFQGVTIL